MRATQLNWAMNHKLCENRNILHELASALRELRGHGLKHLTAGDLLTTYVGAAGQHVLRMSFVSKDEAEAFDIDVIQI